LRGERRRSEERGGDKMGWTHDRLVGRLPSLWAARVHGKEVG